MIDAAATTSPEVFFFGSASPRGRRPENPSIERVKVNHFVDFDGTDVKCVHCSTRQKQKQTSYI